MSTAICLILNEPFLYLDQQKETTNLAVTLQKDDRLTLSSASFQQIDLTSIHPRVFNQLGAAGGLEMIPANERQEASDMSSVHHRDRQCIFI